MPTATRHSATQEAISRLGAGDHLCCIYRNRSEQMGIVVPYLIHGLQNNEKCLYIIDESTREDVFHAFGKAGVDITTHTASGQFVLLTRAEAYLKGGSFDPDRMITTLKQAEADAIKEGYAGLRITGEMTWIFSGLPGVEGLIEYESKLNLFFPGSKSTAICQYHEARFDPDILIDVLHTHPAVVIYGEVCKNPYYIPPDEFLLRMKNAKIPLALYQRVRDDIIARAGLEADRQRLEDELKVLLNESERSRRAMLSNLEDQQRAAVKLQTLTSRQEAILSAIPDIIMEVDCNKVYRWTNQAGVDFFGKDVIGKKAAFYFEGEDTVYRTVQPLFDGDETVIRVESWQRRQDGQKRLLFWQCRALKDTHGNVTGVLSSAHDITERMQLETYREMGREILQILNGPGALPDALLRVIAALKTRTGFDAVGLRLQDGEDFPYCAQQGFSKDFLLTENTLLEHGADGGVCRDKDGNVSLECTCGLVISGKTDAASPLFTKRGSFWTNDSLPLLELPPEKDPRHHPRNQCIHQGYASVALVPIRNQERIIGLLHLNDRRNGRFSIETIELLEGIAEHIGSALMRKRTEDALRASEQEFRSLAESMPQIVWVTRSDGWNIYFNQQWVEYTGLTLEQSYGHGWKAPFHPDDKQRAWDAWQRATQHNDTYSVECRLRRADGVYRWWLIRGVPLRKASGEILKWFGTCTDIEDIKQAEKEREKLQAQFTQAQKMESVGRLAGGVAHDFNNLLMGIMNYAELCRDKIAPDHPIREWLDEITLDVERSAKLTHQLLAFARKQVILPKVLDINDAISGMLKLLQRLIGEDIAMTWRPGPGVWLVKMDPTQIDQILANLVVNSRDAIGGAGSIAIEISIATLDQSFCAGHPGSFPGNFVLLTVSDTGSGMSKEVLDHLFEPFFTTKGEGAGTGLGLATVYGIVKQNEGFINVYSEPGKGTTFKIYLPRFVTAEAAHVAAQTPAPLPRGNETILLVEDEKSIRIPTSLFLEDLGYTVLVAEDPEKALHLVSEHPGEIHLLITDVVMPGMSGRDLANRLLGFRPTIKRLFISGFTADIIAQRGILADGLNFLSKPFGRDQLARKVREVLEAKQGWKGGA